MEPQNYKIIEKFVSDSEVDKILSWVKNIVHADKKPNQHLEELSRSLNGKSFIFDISQTSITQYITKFQAISEVSTDRLPYFLIAIISRISQVFNLPTDHLFLQVVDMSSGGKVNPHYDASVSGYINYKCNISIKSEDYNIYIGEQKLLIKEKDLYGFEASLFKHWTDEFNSNRIMLSFGFMIPYDSMNRNDSDPRVRLSKRIEKHFQASIKS